MKILLASSEALPYSKSGGLADMVGALAKFLARAGHEVRLVTPLYRGMRHQFPDIQPFDWQMTLPMGTKQVEGQVFVRTVEERLTVYFVAGANYFERAEYYTEGGLDYPDNAERFIFFSKAVAHLARYLPWRPDLIHLHDWQVALTPLLMLEEQRNRGWPDLPKTCLTIHNLAYQGHFPAAMFPLTNLPEAYFQPDGVEFYGGLNCLKSGILFADVVTTVSPRYAREITTELFGCGLDGALRRRQQELFGILNGVDYEEWQTEKNPYLPRPYSVSDLGGKAADKKTLQGEMSLAVEKETPLFGIVARLAEQKGIDLLLTVLPEMLAAKMQFIFLGSGQRDYERAFRQLAQRYPGKVAVKIGFDTGLSHRIEAGSDFFLMPSRFEPCGLNQMYSLRYGAVPIVRRTGGLDDSITDLNESETKADGIKFEEYSGRALSKAMRKALVLYEQKELLAMYRLNGMTRDFSWAKTVTSYEQLFAKTILR